MLPWIVRHIVLASLVCSVMPLFSQDVTLASPLTTLARTQTVPDGPVSQLHAVVSVPTDAPTDLGVGAFICDDDGTWWQVLHPGTLSPGPHTLSFDLTTATVHAESHHGRWSQRHAHLIDEAGLFFWSEQSSRNILTIHSLTLADHQATPAASPAPLPRHIQLTDVHGATYTDDAWQATTGERVEWALKPNPMPRDVYDHSAFRLWLTISSETDQRDYSGFYRQPMQLIDAGSHEVGVPSGPDGFAVRWRPQEAGHYRVELNARWPDGTTHSSRLPDIIVSGEPFENYVRVDADDPRFFSTGDGTFVWPIGINARSVYDLRSQKHMGTRLTPDRGWHAYKTYIDRWAAHGITAVEIWMSSWNLALEWRDDWPGYHGIQSYNQVNAERLDRILDYAWQNGVRVNLVINNHGQASSKTDREWEHNPWNAYIHKGTPGPLAQSLQIFSDQRALDGQDRLRKYIIARYADHPAILAWKLWTEINLTDAGRHDRRNIHNPLLRPWHQQAAERWQQLDPYQHPVTTHWSGDYRTPDRSIVALKEISFVSIDAYHQKNKSLGDLFWDGIHDRRLGLGRHRKPIVITEFGGSWKAAPIPQLLAEHRSGPWAALVSGYAASPMLWWFEWVDQNNHYDPYPAIAAFVEGEDLRARQGSQSRAVVLEVTGTSRKVWCRAWARPGRLLAYVMDADWGFSGGEHEPIAGARIVIGENNRAGEVHYQWWDAATGTVTAEGTINHPGGRLELGGPPFRHHAALKLWRD